MFSKLSQLEDLRYWLWFFLALEICGGFLMALVLAFIWQVPLEKYPGLFVQSFEGGLVFSLATTAFFMAFSFVLKSITDKNKPD